MNNIEVKTSPIEGLGIFAVRAFHNGERISRINVIREITADSPIQEELGERIDHCDYPDAKVVLLGFPDRHVNHCCDPNAYQLFQEEASYLISRRDISAGEEITIDYNINITGGTSWPCHCGARRCRKEVAGDYFLLPEERQLEYRPLLADWFVQRNRDRVQAIDQEWKGK
jgi:uncharacterized protein